MPKRKSAHTTLDELRQAAGDERVKQRDLEAQLEAAKAKVESASRGIALAYASEDQRAVARARGKEEEGVAEVCELQHRVDGAALRVERAQHEADAFIQQHAKALLEERAADARELALKLTRAGHEVIQLHRAFVAMRTDIDSLVGAIPNAVVRSDGPSPSHAWERQLRDLERAIRDAAEVEPPLPRWAGVEEREQRDRTNRLLQLRRRKELSAAEEDELEKLNQDRVVTPNVAVLSREEN